MNAYVSRGKRNPQIVELWERVSRGTEGRVQRRTGWIDNPVAVACRLAASHIRARWSACMEDGPLVMTFFVRLQIGSLGCDALAIARASGHGHIAATAVHSCVALALLLFFDYMRSMNLQHHEGDER